MHRPLPLQPQAGARLLTAGQMTALPIEQVAERFVAAVIDEQGREIPITDAMIDAALCAFDPSCITVSTTRAPAQNVNTSATH